MTLSLARSFWITSPGAGALRTEPMPARAAGEVLVQARYSGISRGTEALVFLGKVPPSEHERMRAPFQAGSFPAPVKYGYSNVGVVIEGESPLQGRPVFCLYPHQSEFLVDASAVIPLPESLPPERAVLAANMETALNGIWDADLKPGDRVSVVGAGAVGFLSAWLASQMPGCEVELLDIEPGKQPIAEQLGIRFRTPEHGSGDRDVVIHASGSPAGLVTALALAGFEARIVELSWYGDTRVTLPLGEAFHSKRLQIKASQVGYVAAGQRARWEPRRRLEKALALLLDERLDVLITSESDFDELPRIMAELAAAPSTTICHRVRY